MRHGAQGWPTIRAAPRPIRHARGFRQRAIPQRLNRPALPAPRSRHLPTRSPRPGSGMVAPGAGERRGRREIKRRERRCCCGVAARQRRQVPLLLDELQYRGVVEDVRQHAVRPGVRRDDHGRYPKPVGVVLERFAHKILRVPDIAREQWLQDGAQPRRVRDQAATLDVVGRYGEPETLLRAAAIDEAARDLSRPPPLAPASATPSHSRCRRASDQASAEPQEQLPKTSRFRPSNPPIPWLTHPSRPGELKETAVPSVPSLGAD